MLFMGMAAGVYAYFLCKLVCTCIQESDAELTCTHVFCLGVLTYNVMLQAYEHD